MDPANESLLPEGVDVIRTRALPARLTRRIGFSDLGVRCLPYLWSALASLCRGRRPDLILISVPPNVTMTLGRLAFHRFRIPYVVDYQDPWVIEDYWRVPKDQRPPKWALAYTLSRFLEPFAVKHVSHITGVSRGTTDRVIARYRKLTGEDATEIPFGAEPAEFDYLRANPRPNRIFARTDGLFHVGYVGVCNPAMRETVRALFRALRLGLDRKPELFARVRLHFVGTTYAAGQPFQVLPLAAEAGVTDAVAEHPARIDYLDALQVALDSDALLLIGSDAPHYTASKIFPSILSRRPILAVFHRSSSVVRILSDTRAGAVVCFDEENPPSTQIETIYGHLASMVAAPLREPATDWSALEQYSARAMTARLARVLDRATTAKRKP